MRVLFNPGVVVLAAEDDAEVETLRAFFADSSDHVFHLAQSGPRGGVFRDLGPREEACREPVNIHSGVTDELLKLIGNFAHTPFELHGQRYASVEGFWQGLKFPNEADRRRIAALHGGEAKRAGDAAAPAGAIVYRSATIQVGRPAHWALMRQACLAKFTQHEEARQALLSTGSRPLVHRLRRDSATIPGVIMADIWMGIRARLQGNVPSQPS
jgi:predicted NAD-dependent protein-ADP-ribosyltransferase YbiA (DUF1768 family)